MGFEVVDPSADGQPASVELNRGPVTVKFASAEWDWLNNLIGDARKQDIKLGEATVVREAIYQLAQRGGWPELREALVRRRAFEPGPGPRKR